MKVVQLLDLQGPWWCQVYRDWTDSTAGVMVLSESFFQPLLADDQKASLASLSPWLHPFRHLEGSLAWDTSLLFGHQAFKEVSWVGSYSVVQYIKRLMGQPLYCSAAHAGMWGERLWWWLHLVHMTQQFHLASVAAWLSSTSISHHDLFPHTPLIQLSPVISSPRPGIAPQSLNSSSQLLPLPEDQRPCLGYVWLWQGL